MQCSSSDIPICISLNIIANFTDEFNMLSAFLAICRKLVLELITYVLRYSYLY